MYTPFFAGIAAVFATHRNKKSSKKQATVRSLGTIIGGYFGMAIILLFEFILVDLIHLDELNFILYYFLKFLFVSICIKTLCLSIWEDTCRNRFCSSAWLSSQVAPH